MKKALLGPAPEPVVDPTAERMVVTHSEPGYAHYRISGTCAPDVTVEEVRKKYYHWYFGGREAWVRNGQFGCVIHTD